jgi:primary-amine oxidase
VWVTKYTPDELWAAGTYPNLSRGGDGLLQFVEDQEAIANTDIVIWYILGFRHTPKPKNFPILPVFWHAMTLRPAHFFDRDPSSKLNAEFEPSGQE